MIDCRQLCWFVQELGVRRAAVREDRWPARRVFSFKSFFTTPFMSPFSDFAQLRSPLVRTSTCITLLLSVVLALGPLAHPLPACTSIMVGKRASIDGSVMTSHTCDSHRTSSQVVVVPPAKHETGSDRALVKRCDDEAGPMARYGRVPTGKIPQVAETFGYLAPAYAAMNEHQLAIGESTFEGRVELKSDKGLIDCEMLTRLMLERARTAREAIQISGQLLATYGWCDIGEALTIADPNEVWVLEIIGPGKDQVGAVWAAQRVPDDHVCVVANSARIGELNLANADYYMASANVIDVATAHGFWNPQSGQPFRFYEAYNPDGRTSFASTRREWRVLSMLAPSLDCIPTAMYFLFR